jgi:ribosomal protein L10
MTRRQVAEALGMTVAEVRGVEERGLKKMRRLLRWRGLTWEVVRTALASEQDARCAAKATGPRPTEGGGDEEGNE